MNGPGTAWLSNSSQVFPGARNIAVKCPGLCLGAGMVWGEQACDGYCSTKRDSLSDCQ